VIELADLRGHPARIIARRHKAMLEAHFAKVLAKANVAAPRERAREILLVHGDRRYAVAAALAAKKLGLPP
jgi:UDP-N-acetylglucosamine 2-epimerase